jgi:hypothetical protein
MQALLDRAPVLFVLRKPQARSSCFKCCVANRTGH